MIILEVTQEDMWLLKIFRGEAQAVKIISFSIYFNMLLTESYDQNCWAVSGRLRHGWVKAFIFPLELVI